jgi:anti-anti-sigma factor
VVGELSMIDGAPRSASVTALRDSKRRGHMPSRRRNPMNIAEEQVANLTFVAINGRIDSNTAKALGEKLTGLIAGGRTQLIVDLERVVYISSAGFRVLLVAGGQAEAANGILALCSLSQEIQRLFDLGAFTDLFTIYSTRSNIPTNCPSRSSRCGL